MAIIPPHTAEGVLPPFVGGPTLIAHRSPYRASTPEVAARWGTSLDRIAILRGLLKYRTRLRAAGVRDGFQWLDGSFVDQLMREPRDVDVVTFLVSPDGYNPETFLQFLDEGFRELAHPHAIKESYRVDGYYVHLDDAPDALVGGTHYWYGLFSHQRESLLWRGFVEIPFDGDASADLEADAMLARSAELLAAEAGAP